MMKTDTGLTPSLPVSDPGNAAPWRSKRKNSLPSVLYVTNSVWMPFQTTAEIFSAGINFSLIILRKVETFSQPKKWFGSQRYVRPSITL